jgi:NAD+ diphosphatase
VTRGDRCLLGRQRGWPPRLYSALAGFVEPGETLEEAVRREVLEESGVRVGEVEYVASQPWPFPSSLMLGCLARAESEEIRLDPAELEAAAWFSRERVALALAQEAPELVVPPRFAVASALLRRWVDLG